MGCLVPQDCHAKCNHYTPGLNDQERTRCEIWTRVMGYHRPVSAFNAGKRAEHAERQYFTAHLIERTHEGGVDDR
jgi:anaerobic ribonucleoside-triphosphate reductase